MFIDNDHIDQAEREQHCDEMEALASFDEAYSLANSVRRDAVVERAIARLDRFKQQCPQTYQAMLTHIHADEDAGRDLDAMLDLSGHTQYAKVAR